MKQKSNLVKNASFLMIAALVSKIIGLVYKIPLSNTVGEVGMGYYGLAQSAYLILLMISSFSIPQAVSKVISERLAFRQYKNAQKMFRGALLYAVVVGGAVSLFCFFGAPLIIPSNQPNAVLALQVLTPTIFLSGILGVYRGYFQAYNNMLPTSVSQILEQIAHAVVSIGAAWLFIEYVSDGTTESVAKWGAAGGTIGTGAGVVIALLFMLLVYALNRGGIRRRLASDRSREVFTYGQVLKIILLIVTPIIFSSFIYNVNGYINGKLYSEIMGQQGMDASLVSALYGEYSVYFMSIINIPLTLASTAPMSMIPEVSAAYAVGDMQGTRNKIDIATQLSMFISIPCAVGLSVLAYPIVRLLFASASDVTGTMLIIGGITILLNGMSNISNGVLQGIGKPNIPMINAAIALAANLVVLLLLLFFTPLGVYAIVVSMIVYAIVMCVLNDMAMKKYIGYKNPWKQAYIYPLIACVPMGVVAWCIYYGLRIVLPINVICLAVSIPLAALTYLIVYIFAAKVSPQQLRGFPGGTILVKIAGMLRLFRE